MKEEIPQKTEEKEEKTREEGRRRSVKKGVDCAIHPTKKKTARELCNWSARLCTSDRGNQPVDSQS